jgi:hypothetical protein
MKKPQTVKLYFPAKIGDKLSNSGSSLDFANGTV